MKLTDFDFTLPQELIAHKPAEPRDSARLLCSSSTGEITDLRVSDITGLLRPGDVMVFNNTKVIPAFLQGFKRSAEGQVSQVKINLHKRLDEWRWQVFAKPGKKLKPGNQVDFSPEFHAKVLSKNPESGEVELEFFADNQDSFFANLARVGMMPLPPYIDRNQNSESNHANRYQTVFAANEGAVAAPTAGLHFTEELLAQIKAQGVHTAYVTLHVGGGTFLPVKHEDISQHSMHEEFYSIDAQNAEIISKARSAGGRVIAVGTTSLRVLETVANAQGEISAASGDTGIFITPGYQFKIIDVLWTNFHLPKSTLFMLVSALKGLDYMHKLYQHAIDNQYRFFSYGDASWLEKSPTTSTDS
jgi:S-adenosylmethionine:tRNA ribosyltransferase-isomerase